MTQPTEPKNAPKRIQRKRTKGWRMPENAVYVGRPTRWGNPFTIAGAIESEFATDRAHARTLVVSCFANWYRFGPQSDWWFSNSAELHSMMHADIGQLRGHDLACWCPLSEPCHADVLLEIANA